MTNADNINKNIKQMNFESSAEMRDRIISDASLAMEETINASANKPGIRRIIMHSKTLRLAVAAVVIIGAMIGINQFGGSIDGASTAWATVLEEINNFQAVTYKKTFDLETQSFTSNVMLTESGLMRSESQNAVSIRDFASGVSLQMQPIVKDAVITHKTNLKVPIERSRYFQWLKKLHEQDTEFIGEEEIDGIAANKYVCEVPFERTTAWVNPETNLPVKVKIESFPNTDPSHDSDPVVMPMIILSNSDFLDELELVPDENGNITTKTRGTSIGISSSRRSGKGIQEKMTITYHDFNWQAKLDMSLFSTIPPKDYTVKIQEIDSSEPGENHLIYTLKFWATMSEGKFPDAINDLSDPEKIKPLLIAKFNKDGDYEKEFDAAVKEANEVVKGLYFAQDKKVEGSWGYDGKGIMLGDADAIICWWEDAETGGYKAVFGDLSVEVIVEDQIPAQK